MILSLDQKIEIRVQAVTNSLPLDEGLALIQQFLTERFEEARRGDGLLPAGVSELIIDLEVLGVKDHGAKQAEVPSWKGYITYPIKLARSLVILGPLYMPELPTSPCPYCLSRRWFNNRRHEEQRSMMRAQQMTATGHNPRITTFTLDALWQVFCTSLEQAETTARNSVFPFYVLNLETLQVSQHALLQDSSCPACLTPQRDSSEAALFELTSRPKSQLSHYRLVKATDYDLPTTALINPISGVMGQGSIAEMVHTLSSPVFGQFETRSMHGLYTIMWSGHGNSYHQSLYLGLLEAIERYSGLIPRGKIPNVYDCYNNLADQALDPRTCGLYQPEFYQMSSDYLPFSPEQPLWWVWGYSFQQNRPILIPEQLVYYMNYRHVKTNFVHDCSSGCATGSCLEEAILYGLLELIERDAFLMTWYARLAPPKINPRSSHSPETLFALEGIERLGYDLHLFDTRFDIRIPSILAVAKRKEPGLANIVVSAGAGLDPEDAIRSALCELISYIPSMLQRIEGKVEQIQAMIQDYSKVTDLEHHPQLFALPEMARHLDFLLQNPEYRSLEETYRDWQDIWPRHQDLYDDLKACIGMIQQLEMDVIVVDQTAQEHAHTGLKTVCVLVPGLLPIDFGWKRERVFDLPRFRTVPRTAGYRTDDFEPDMQNVIPHPFP